MSLTCSPFLVRVVTMAPNTLTAHRFHMLFTPDPKSNVVLTQIPQTFGVPAQPVAWTLFVTPRECTSRSLSLSQTHCLHAELTLWISRKNLTLFPSPKICVPPSWLIFCFSVPEKYFAPIGKIMWGYGLWAGRCICGPGQAVCSQRGQQ